MIRDRCSFFLFSSFLVCSLFFAVLAGTYVKMLLEYFTEVFRITESCHFCYFCYAMCVLFQQLHGLLQPDQTDIISRSLVGQCPEFVVETCTAHAYQVAKYIYGKGRVIYIVFYMLFDVGNKLPVNVL